MHESNSPVRFLSPRFLLLLLIAICLPAWAQFDQKPEAEPSALPPLNTQTIQSSPPVAQGIDLTASTDDLWVRMRNGFSMPNLNDEVVLSQQQWFQNRPDYLRRVVDRSRRYLFYIVEELEKRGMPTEIALLPMVESSFNPMAYSKAHASGLWQFIPATGKRYDLEQNWWHDQRRDVVASTGAALDYLQTIYEMNGDWHLALASYNWGEYAVKRAVQKNIARGLSTDFTSLTMPAETRSYVPKLQALKNIFSNPALMASLGIPSLPNQPYFSTYEPKRPMDVAVAARLANMPIEEFRALNPAHNRPLINPEIPILIPADRVETFQSNLENHRAPLATWQLYTFRQGEKIEQIAPRFGITLDDLKRINGLKGRLRITAGSSVLVPVRNGADPQSLPDQVRLPEIMPDPPPKARGKGKAAVRESNRTRDPRNAAPANKAQKAAGGKAKPATAGKSGPKPATKAAAKPATKAALAKPPASGKPAKRHN